MEIVEEELQLPNSKDAVGMPPIPLPTILYLLLMVVISSITTPSFKVIYHPLYSMNKLVINKSKLPQDGAQVFPYVG